MATRKKADDYEEQDQDQEQDEYDNEADTAEKDAPKPAEQGQPGTKSVLTKAKNARPVDTVARREDITSEGDLDEDKSAQDQIHSSNIPPERDPDKKWQEFAVQAVNGMYPRLRDGTDFAIGRKTINDDVELLKTAEGVTIDWGAVEEAARKLADADPYGAGYTAQPQLAGGLDPGDESGEVPVKPSGSAPRRETQARAEGQRNQPQPFVQPTPPPDPYFNPDGSRK